MSGEQLHTGQVPDFGQNIWRRSWTPRGWQKVCHLLSSPSEYPLVRVCTELRPCIAILHSNNIYFTTPHQILSRISRAQVLSFDAKSNMILALGFSRYTTLAIICQLWCGRIIFVHASPFHASKDLPRARDESVCVLKPYIRLFQSFYSCQLCSSSHISQAS